MKTINVHTIVGKAQQCLVDGVFGHALAPALACPPEAALQVPAVGQGARHVEFCNHAQVILFDKQLARGGYYAMTPAAWNSKDVRAV